MNIGLEDPQGQRSDDVEGSYDEQGERPEGAASARVEELERRLFERNTQLAATSRQLSREIAQRRRLEAQKARLLHDLEEAVRLRDEFLTLASHEFKTPVTALHLQLQAIVSAVARGEVGAALAERLSARARIAQRQVERLTRLVDGLLDITRLSTGRMPLELEELQLDEVLREVVARFAEETALVGSEVRLAFAGEDGAGRWAGRWDRLRLEQVFTNLLSNALKFGAHKPIDITAEVVDAHVEVRVRDEGIGVAEEDQERIFLRFGRAVSGRHYGGFGLGLWLAREAVRALGGEIGVVSKPGAGATFIVRLPKQGPAAAGRPGEPGSVKVESLR